MKRRAIDPDVAPETSEESLCRALLALDTVPDMRAFLRDLSTPSEREAMIDRWSVVPFLLDGVPYRDIHERTGVSITTIGRVARCLNEGNGGYQKALTGMQSRRRATRKTGTKA
ncbi:MAG TPA: YerC/YecD family TrpR-related protein [Oleiagrimonas sp.]|nr:YerC/YecD family TrpR-related protein [Oleiagrimonas sp.]